MKNSKNKNHKKQHFVHPAFIGLLLVVVVAMGIQSGTFFQGNLRIQPLVKTPQQLKSSEAKISSPGGNSQQSQQTETVLPQLVASPVTIKNSQDQDLNAYVYKPPGNGPFSAVVLLHGCSGLMTGTNHGIGSEFKYWGNLLSDEGYAVILVDSFTTRDITTVCGNGTILNEAGIRPLDAYAGLKYLQDQTFVKDDKIAVMGWSNGASAGLSALAKNNNPANPADGAKFVGGIFDYPGCGLRARYGTDYSNPARVNLGTYLPYAPVQILAGENDTTTPPSPKCVNLVARAQALGASIETGNPITMTTYPGAKHGFDRAKENNSSWTEADVTARDSGRSAVLTFLKTYLQ